MSKASDNKYCYLANFLSWINATFYPVLNDKNIKVTVELGGIDGSLSEESTCTRYNHENISSGIMDAVAAVNWSGISSFSVEMTVSLPFSLCQLHVFFAYSVMGGLIHQAVDLF